MKLKLGEIKSVIIGLRNVYDKKLPVALSYSIASNEKMLLEKYKEVEEHREKIFKETCLKDDGGVPIMLKNEKNGTEEYTFETDAIKKEAISKVEELYELDEDFEIRTVTMNVIELTETDPKYDILTAQDMSALLFMIK